jgi:ligand-binding SRPBCC domain-containing protein
MFLVKDSIHIHAPIERCFLLSTSVELVEKTLNMRAVAGKVSGLVVEGDTVVWRGWKFGLPQLHESLITQYERPVFFQDTMSRGRFKRFQHDHQFAEVDEQTLLTDKVRFSLPFGRLGKLVAKQVLVPHISRLLQQRMLLLKRAAESEEWRQYLPAEEREGQIPVGVATP